MMISYSSNNEDIMLVRALRDIKFGSFIDIGCAQAVEGSNTYALYQRGWSGVACDPIFNFEPNWALEWCAIRPRDAIVRDAIGAEMGETEFWMCNWRGLSTCDDATVERHLKRDPTNVRSSSNGSKVAMVTINRVIDKLLDGKTPDLICIDVEGLEEKVLQGIDLVRHRPAIFLIEAYRPDFSPHYSAWEPILLQAGYHNVWDDQLNRFYVADERKKEIDPHFVYPPNCSDGYIPYKEYELQRRVTDYENNHAILSIG